MCALCVLRRWVVRGVCVAEMCLRSSLLLARPPALPIHRPALLRRGGQDRPRKKEHNRGTVHPKTRTDQTRGGI
ncbi:uncharacterized protein B0I36DRAFT_326825 [Microdochium trichocladiopsis]|uniref:Uncharacterized protein n=1 Tax=Microdochium trichocladiopsis TaxID=1682393 RepID=A0A9P8Y493_9PEZI|nr:uncharacterized protein B0I36DRAFT_326825 [Microdochium trichocladiopsis]KAH7027291.1 hypothetical protein B0I36DRAFT_326825 [Microdochium trichocladiopsis]